MLVSAAVFSALAAVVASWVYTNIYLVVVRLVATAKIPEPKGNLLLGHIPQFVAIPGRSYKLFYQWSKKLGPIIRVRFFHRPVVVVTDPDLYQPLLRTGPLKLPKYTAPYHMFEVFTSPHRSNILSSPENATWKAVRRAAVAALTMNNLRLCFPHITRVTLRLIAALEAAGPDVAQDMDLAAGKVTVDVIGLAAFACDLGATCSGGSRTSGGADGEADEGQQYQQQQQQSLFGRGAEVQEVVHHLTEAMQRRNNPLNRWFPWRQAYRDLMYWGARMTTLVLDLMADLEARPPPAHTLGAHLMALRTSEGGPLSRDQVGAELGLFWAAGFETTAHTICWTLFLLATHPDVEAKLCAELATLGLMATPDKPQPDPLQWEHLAQLKYLAAVLQESMRLFPVVSSGTIRITDKPINLAGHRLPAGQPILIPFYSIHRSPKLWTDPDRFKPERWIDSATMVPSAAAAPAEQVSTGGSGGIGGSSEATSSDEYVDVGEDLAQMRDQLKEEQQLAQQGGFKQENDISAGAQPPSAQAGPGNLSVQASESTVVKGSGAGLELKDPALGRRGFLPFSEGSRNCVGQALALVELKVVLALLMGHLHFELSPDMGGYGDVEQTALQFITLRPAHGLMMKVRHRGKVA
eukprot:gene3654-3915_t